MVIQLYYALHSYTLVCVRRLHKDRQSLHAAVAYCFCNCPVIILPKSPIWMIFIVIRFRSILFAPFSAAIAFLRAHPAFLPRIYSLFLRSGHSIRVDMMHCRSVVRLLLSTWALSFFCDNSLLMRFLVFTQWFARWKHIDLDWVG